MPFIENDSLKETQQEHKQALTHWVNGQRSLQEIKTQLKSKNFKV